MDIAGVTITEAQMWKALILTAGIVPGAAWLAIVYAYFTTPFPERRRGKA